MADRYDEQAENAEDRAGVVRSVLVTDQPKKITAASAKQVEGRAINAKDLDTDYGREDAAAAPGASRPPEPDASEFIALPGLNNSSVKQSTASLPSRKKPRNRAGKRGPRRSG